MANGPEPVPQRSRLGRLGHAILQTFFKGLIAILPIAATVYVLVALANILESPTRKLIEPLLTYKGTDGEFHSHYYPGTGFLVAVLVICVLGVLINAWLVQQFLAASESLLKRLPVAKTVLSSVRDLMGFFAKSGKQPAGQVVLVSLSPTGPKLIGFVTRQDLTDANLGGDAQDLVAVYCPFSYALGGFTLLVQRSAIQPANMKAEEAMRFALTAGMKKADEPAKK